MNKVQTQQSGQTWRNRFAALLVLILIGLASQNVYRFYSNTSKLTDQSQVFQFQELVDLRRAQKRLAKLKNYIPDSQVGYLNVQLIRGETMDESWRESVQYVLAPILLKPDPAAGQSYLIADFPNDELLKKFEVMSKRTLLLSPQKGLGLFGPPPKHLPQQQEMQP